MMKPTPLLICLTSVFIASCAIDPEFADPEFVNSPQRRTPVKINEASLPTDPVSDKEIIHTINSPQSPLSPNTNDTSGFRTPDIVNSLPSENQTSGTAPLEDKIDDDVSSGTTIRAGE